MKLSLWMESESLRQNQLVVQAGALKSFIKLIPFFSLLLFSASVNKVGGQISYVQTNVFDFFSTILYIDIV